MHEQIGDGLDALIRPGQVFAGKYRVEKILGAGAMGVVVAAWHLDLDQWVAIKLMRPEMAGEADAVVRFLREARAAARIQSEHVARVLDVSRLENGAPYIVMEHLSGTDLDQLLQERGPLPIEEAVEYVLQACEAIAEAHRHGIVHRDLKPSNLFLARRADGSPLVKVLDFGISKMSRGAQATLERSLTGATEVMGTPHYMSPEQIRSMKDVDGRADIWALGVILYRLLTTEHPFEAENLGACLVKIAVDPPVSLRSRRASVPVELEAVVLDCLEKNRDKRLQTVAALAERLGPFASVRCRESVDRIVRVVRGGELRHGGGAAQEALPARAAPAADEMSTPALSTSQATRPMTRAKSWRSRRVLVVVSAVAVLATCAGAVAVLVARQEWPGEGQRADGPADGSPRAPSATLAAPAPALAASPMAAEPVAPVAEPSTTAATPSSTAPQAVPSAPPANTGLPSIAQQPRAPQPATTARRSPPKSPAPSIDPPVSPSSRPKDEPLP
ncbi:MAG TPA: protein kinase, partial [Thermoanaerobaculia bacterium]|nr:protein kinase [Thermoanaerobaculia bacterium]